MFPGGLKKDLKIKLDKILLDPTNKNPFPPPPNAADFFKNRPHFMIGREKYIEKLKSLIERSINDPSPVLVEILGKQGIGKSTLVCWIYTLMEKDGLLNKAPMIFLNAMGNPDDFKGIAFYKQISSSFIQSGLMKNLAFQSMQYFVKRLWEIGGRCKESLTNKIAKEDIDKIISDTNFFIENENKCIDFIPKILELFKNNFIFLQNEIKFDQTFIYTLWNCFYSPSAYDAHNAISGKGSFRNFEIITESDAFRSLKDLIELNLWINDGKATMIIVFDHLEACVNDQKEDNFNTLFSLLLRLRQFSHISIILSGILDAFDAMIDILESDLELQLSNWAYNMSLSSLNEETVTSIISKYLEEFWSDKLYCPPVGYKLYPFGENSIKYLYNAQQKDLRKTVRFLYDKMENFRNSNEIRIITSFFDAIKEYRLRKDLILSSFEQEFFIEKLKGKDFQDKERSTKVELAITELFEILKDDVNYKFISDVKHEPPIGPNKEKPDIFVEFFGNEIQEDIKKMAFEVKIYTKSLEVGRKDIEKTHILLTSKKIDFLWWITNVPLSTHKYELKEEFNNHIGRIGELKSIELAYIAFIVFFEDIFKRKPTAEEANQLLIKIGLNLNELVENLKTTKKLVKEPQTKIKAPKWQADDILNQLRQQINLEQTSLEQTSLEQTSLEQTSLEQTSLEQTSLEQTSLEQTNLEQTNLEQTSLEQTSLEQTSLEQTSLEQTSLEQIFPQTQSTTHQESPIKLSRTPRNVVELDDNTLKPYISEVIQEKSSQANMRITTFFTELKKQFKISVENEEDKHRIAILSKEIAKELGYRSTSASIMFK